ncbi:MAG: gliding motility protein GldC [Cytophagales bacterium]|nr:gliding motility protein GldC [Cytophagales bacterium]
MKKSEINFLVELDHENVPERMLWQATDSDAEAPQETKAISIALWDQQNLNSLRIDLWTKDMPVDEMKRFFIDCLGGMAQTVLSATGDEYMSNELNTLCEKLVEHIKAESN